MFAPPLRFPPPPDEPPPVISLPDAMRDPFVPLQGLFSMVPRLAGSDIKPARFRLVQRGGGTHTQPIS